MSDIIVFDWGDTLMRDLDGMKGPMKDWPHVEAVEGAQETLARLVHHVDIFVASGAQESAPEDIESALGRVGLSAYILGYFCPKNLGFDKPSSEFYTALADKLPMAPENITFVGDSLENDIIPALAIGMRTIWLSADESNNENVDVPKGAIKIRSLSALCDIILP
ncbi:MAG: FMN phosphatase YigB (HAD superfamily) [Flavobacteriales bacterium]|jgi:FMN phosphatase YigB (HAD superfamily)